MVDNFYSDMRQARGAELIVKESLSQLTDAYTFEDVANEREYRHKGDILAIERATGKRVFIEVKDDSCIARTRNVLCEESVWFEDDQEMRAGNMHCDSHIYCVVSQQERRIYVLDFETLKRNYKKGIYKVIPHPKQTTYCYLCSLHQVAEWGAGICTIDY